MAGFVPDEGEVLLGNVLLKRILTDRDANLEIGLYINASVSEATKESDITEPAVGSYARITITDANWIETAGVFTLASVDFKPSGANWSGANAIRGAFIVTKTAAGTQRLLFVMPDTAAPVTVNDGQTYRVDLTGTPA